MGSYTWSIQKVPKTIGFLIAGPRLSGRGSLGIPGESWGGLARSGEPWGNPGEPWGALGSSGKPWGALGSSGQPWGALGARGPPPGEAPIAKESGLRVYHH